MQMYKIQDGIRPPFWKSVNRHISVKNCPILMKFGTLHQILNPVTVTWPKIEIFGIKMAATAILKITFSAITHWPIVWFRQNFVCGSRTACRQRPQQKMQIFKIQDGRWPPFWKSLYRYISVKNRRILIKYGTLHQILNQITVTWPKSKIFKFEMAMAAILKIAFLAITY